MSIAAGAPGWLVALFLLLLGLAAVEDGWRMRISNLLVVLIVATGIGAMILTGIGWAAWEPLLFAALVLAIGTPLFAAGWMGGGDVKLLAATALWFTYDGSWKMIVAVAIAGGVLALIALAIRRVNFSAAVRERIAFLQRGKGIPYGIAVAAGVAAVVVSSRSAVG